jgi:hypothetical protein
MPIHVTSERLDFFRNLSLIMGFLINIVMIAALKRDVGVNTTAIDTVNSDLFGVDATVFIKILGAIQLGTSIGMFVFWAIINASIIL